MKAAIGVRPDVDHHLVLRHLVDPNGLRPCAMVDLGRDDRIGRKHEPHALAPCLGQDALGVVELILLDQALAELTLRRQERVRHPATDEHRLASRQERVEDLELAGDLRAADDGMEWLRGPMQQA